MNQLITTQLHFFLLSILWGGIILLAYDMFRIFRRMVNHDSFFIAVEDLIFWVAASLFIFAMIYEENDGIIRGFSVIGMIIGSVLYHYIISEFLIKSVTKLLELLFRPFLLVFQQIKKTVSFLMKITKNTIGILHKSMNKWYKKMNEKVEIRKNKKKELWAKKHEKKALKKMKNRSKMKADNEGRQENQKKRTSKQNNQGKEVKRKQS